MCHIIIHIIAQMIKDMTIIPKNLCLKTGNRESTILMDNDFITFTFNRYLLDVIFQQELSPKEFPIVTK